MADSNSKSVRALKNKFIAGATPSETDYQALIDLADIGRQAVGANLEDFATATPGAGLKLVAGALSLKPKEEDSGLKATVDGVAVDVGDGLVVDPKSKKLTLNLDANSALDAQSGPLKLKTGDGFVPNSSTLTLKLADKSGLALSSEANGKGLQVLYDKDKSGLERDGSALKVKVDSAMFEIGKEGLKLTADHLTKLEEVVGGGLDKVLQKVRAFQYPTGEFYLQFDMTKLSAGERKIWDALIKDYNIDGSIEVKGTNIETDKAAVVPWGDGGKNVRDGMNGQIKGLGMYVLRGTYWAAKDADKYTGVVPESSPPALQSSVSGLAMPVFSKFWTAFTNAVNFVKDKSNLMEHDDWKVKTDDEVGKSKKGWEFAMRYALAWSYFNGKKDGYVDGKNDGYTKPEEFKKIVEKGLAESKKDVNKEYSEAKVNISNLRPDDYYKIVVNELIPFRRDEFPALSVRIEPVPARIGDIIYVVTSGGNGGELDYKSSDSAILFQQDNKRTFKCLKNGTAKITVSQSATDTKNSDDPKTVEFTVKLRANDLKVELKETTSDGGNPEWVFEYQGGNGNKIEVICSDHQDIVQKINVQKRDGRSGMIVVYFNSSGRKIVNEKQSIRFIFRQSASSELDSTELRLVGQDNRG
ncbi:hypothetical protein [Chromobacterium haemolyticum]|uniref:hypothetical protein n=1 Tax=Chromobacterium haemolyticum TaxID=394935 RepID=UPI002447386B|nr:hypothetical protein [Chromobacterium haemolyticum]MDH0342430.1 hypothetical protein [Chromobacterium haemolyticum]